MNSIPIKSLFLLLCLNLLFHTHDIQAQSIAIRQTFDYYELKSLLLKHKSTIESILSMKRFKLDSTKERPESIIYGYKKDTVQILVRVRKGDGLSSEIAWTEGPSTLVNLTHDAVRDGFVPVAGNSWYYNRFQKTALLVNYKLAEGETVPCILRTAE